MLKKGSLSNIMFSIFMNYLNSLNLETSFTKSDVVAYIITQIIMHNNVNQRIHLIPL